MKHSIYYILLSLLVVPFFAQAQLWEKPFDKEVNFIKMTDVGVAVVGTKDALYGIDNKGEVLWRNEKLKKLEENRVEVLSGSELIFASDKGLFARNRVINVLNGVEYADSNVKGANIFGAKVIHPTNTLLVMPGGKTIDAWDIAKNEKIWSIGKEIPYGIATQKMASLTATFVGMQPVQYTSQTTGIMHLGLGHLAEYDFTTGVPKWTFDFGPYKLKKPGKKKADKASNPAAGFAVMKVDEASNTLYFPFRNLLIAVDTQTGKAKWDPKANKIGKIRDLHILPEGILVLKENGLQLIDAATGMAKWEKPLKIKGADSGLLVQDGDQFYMVSKKYVLSIDVANKSTQQLTDKIKFQGGESFSSIEIMDDLIVLSSSQNLVGINKATGEITYQAYYKAPGAGLLNIAQNMVLATVALAATANSQRLGKQSANALGNYSYFQYTPATIDAGTHKSQQSNEFMYINTKFKKKGFGLARVNKKNGELAEEIIIGSRSPIYAKDEGANLIFYKSDKKKVSCRKLN